MHFTTLLCKSTFLQYSRKILCEKVYETLEAEGKSENSYTSNTFYQVKFLFRPKARQVWIYVYIYPPDEFSELD